MPYQEKNAWTLGILALVSYLSYLVIVLSMSTNTPLTEISYAPAMFWTIGGSILLSILVQILVGIFSPQDSGTKDQRDREIGRFGDYIGQAFLVIGGVGALLLAIFELGYFWIANLLYLAFVLSAILSSTAKIFAYRRGFQTW
ncbi:hypothetical protein FHU41_000760 [Psychromicrobium silvestre]|uniref:Uncharacterized protein n=1 Tax=Psychromicrobium silvestre TaxID=1645614 RepID=A0A7Y9LS12_9MICC|nr:hypothetical protein [Psychromicrobium silvestre]NYE94539.1 hypothetical protein [Psychromicrobium silvestre]